MKKIVAIVIFFGFFATCFGQKTAQEYFTVSSQLYIANQQEQALYLVSRGCELYESDSSLAQLKRLIEGKNDNKKNTQQQNKNDNKNQDDNKDNGQNQDNQSGQDGNDQKQQQNQQKGNQNEQGQQGNDQQQQQSQGKQSEANGQDKKDGKGQISTVQAEALLDAIEGNDKAVQQRMMQQQKNKKKNTYIDKNW